MTSLIEDYWFSYQLYHDHIIYIIYLVRPDPDGKGYQSCRIIKSQMWMWLDFFWIHRKMSNTITQNLPTDRTPSGFGVTSLLRSGHVPISPTHLFATQWRSHFWSVLRHRTSTRSPWRFRVVPSGWAISGHPTATSNAIVILRGYKKELHEYWDIQC